MWGPEDRQGSPTQPSIWRMRMGGKHVKVEPSFLFLLGPLVCLPLSVASTSVDLNTKTNVNISVSFVFDLPTRTYFETPCK